MMNGLKNILFIVPKLGFFIVPKRSEGMPDATDDLRRVVGYFGFVETCRNISIWRVL